MRKAAVDETLLDELKRYVRFGAEDEAALRAFAARAAPHYKAITEHFYERLSQHENAQKVFSGPEQVERLKGTLREWLATLFGGPWDREYFERRSRIGRVHVRIGLPQRYMFAAMNVIRIELIELSACLQEPERLQLASALHKIIDIELAIMLETYGESFVEKVQLLEREERADIERQLRLSEARYDEIVEKAEALITTSDQAGRILLFNSKAAEVTGLAPQQAVGCDWLELFVAEPERAGVRASFGTVLDGACAVTYEGAVPGAVVNHGQRRVRWHFTTLPGRAAPALCAIGIDVTNEHALSVRTRRAERLAALGTMAAGLAHEIRNPLNSAHLQLSVARRRLARGGGEELQRAEAAVSLAEGEMKRLAGLVEDFLQFARPQTLRLARANLRATAEVIVELVAPTASAAQVDLSLAPGPAVTVESDDEKVKQVLLNLVRNAIEAAGPGGHVRLEVGESEGFALLAVQDDGPGLPQDAPIFEPFFTTKEQGTGLGLAIVHRIVLDHGGTIGFESRPGRTVFRVALPMAQR